MLKRNTSKINTSVVDAPIEAERLTTVKGIHLDSPVTDLNSVKHSENFEIDSDGTYTLRKPLIFNGSTGLLATYLAPNIRILITPPKQLHIFEDGVNMPILFKYTDINNKQHYVRQTADRPNLANYDLSNVYYFKASDSIILTGVKANLVKESTADMKLYDSAVMSDAYASSASRYLSIYYDEDKESYIVELINPEPNTLVTDSNNITFNPNLALDNIYAIKDLYNYGSLSVSNIVRYTRPNYTYSSNITANTVQIRDTDVLFRVEHSGLLRSVKIYANCTISFKNPIFSENTVPDGWVGKDIEALSKTLTFKYTVSGGTTMELTKSVIVKSVIPAGTLICTIGDNAVLAMENTSQIISLTNTNLTFYAYPGDVSLDKLNDTIPLTIVSSTGINISTLIRSSTDNTWYSMNNHLYDKNFKFEVKYTEQQNFKIVSADNTVKRVLVDTIARDSTYCVTNVDSSVENRPYKDIYNFRYAENSSDHYMTLHVHTYETDYVLYDNTDTVADLTERVTDVKYALVGKVNTTDKLPFIYKAVITTQNKIDNHYCLWEYSTDDGVSWNTAPEFLDQFANRLVDIPVQDATTSNESLTQASSYTKIVKCVPFNNITYSNKDLISSRPDILCVMNPNYTYRYRFTIYKYNFGASVPSKYVSGSVKIYTPKIKDYYIISDDSFSVHLTITDNTSNLYCKVGYTTNLSTDISIQNCNTSINISNNIATINVKNFIALTNLSQSLKLKILFYEGDTLLTNLTTNCIYYYFSPTTSFKYIPPDVTGTDADVPYYSLNKYSTDYLKCNFSQLLFNTTEESTVFQYGDTIYDSLDSIVESTPKIVWRPTDPPLSTQFSLKYSCKFNIYNNSNIPQVISVYQLEYYSSLLKTVNLFKYTLDVGDIHISMEETYYAQIPEKSFVVKPFSNYNGTLSFSIKGKQDNTLSEVYQEYPQLLEIGSSSPSLSDLLRILFIQTTFSTVDCTYNICTDNIFLKNIISQEHNVRVTEYPQKYNTNLITDNSIYNNLQDGVTIKVYSPGTVIDNVSVAVKAYAVSTKETTTLETTQNETELLTYKHIDITSGKSLYYNNQIFTYLVPKNENNVYVSDTDSFITPMYNTIDLAYGSKVTSIIPWRSYLTIFTESSIYLASYDRETGAYNSKLLNTSVGLSKLDRRTPAAMLNSIIFKSGAKVYKMTPNLYSTSDSILNLHCISDAIKDYLPTNTECFAFSTDDKYFLFSPQSTDTLLFVYDYAKGVWTIQRYPVVLKDYILLGPTNLRVMSAMKEFIFNQYLSKLAPEVLEHNLPYGDYLNFGSSIMKDYIPTADTLDEYVTPFDYKIDFGQKSSKYADSKQFLSTRVTVETLSEKDSFNFTVDVLIDGTPRPIHIDATTDSAIWKTSLLQLGTLNTDYTTDTSTTTGILRQLMLKYSGRGRTVRHILSGKSKYRFKLYSLDYKFRNLPNK